MLRGVTVFSSGVIGHIRSEVGKKWEKQKSARIKIEQIRRDIRKKCERRSINNKKIWKRQISSFRGTYWTEWPFVTNAKKKYMKKYRKSNQQEKKNTTAFSRDVLDGMAICELCIHKFNNEMFTNQHACAQK